MMNIMIINQPRHRLHGEKVYVRADNLRSIPHEIENNLIEHRKEATYLYQIEQQMQSNDTIENRFLKFALNQIINRYEALRHRIENIKTASDVLKNTILNMSNTLKRLQKHPFFSKHWQFQRNESRELSFAKSIRL